LSAATSNDGLCVIHVLLLLQRLEHKVAVLTQKVDTDARSHRQAAAAAAKERAVLEQQVKGNAVQGGAVQGGAVQEGMVEDGADGKVQAARTKGWGTAGGGRRHVERHATASRLQEP
jgi:hypothetical protein